MIVKRSAIWTALAGMVLGAGAAAFLMWPEQSFLKKTDEETVEAVSAQAAAVKKGSLPQNVEEEEDWSTGGRKHFSPIRDRSRRNPGGSGRKSKEGAGSGRIG